MFPAIFRHEEMHRRPTVSYTTNWHVGLFSVKKFYYQIEYQMSIPKEAAGTVLPYHLGLQAQRKHRHYYKIRTLTIIRKTVCQPFQFGCNLTLFAASKFLYQRTARRKCGKVLWKSNWAIFYFLPKSSLPNFYLMTVCQHQMPQRS